VGLEVLIIAVAVLVIAAIAVIPLVAGRRHRHGADDSGQSVLDREPGVGEEPGPPGPVRPMDDQEDVPPGEPPGVATATEEVIAPRRRFRERLGRSRAAIAQGLSGLLTRGVGDEEAWEELEEALLSADVGVATTTELIERLRERARASHAAGAELRELLREALLAEVGTSDRTLALDLIEEDRRPGIVLVVGVNGTGKTTTVGKLALALAEEGKQVVLAAADTFRAAATEQLVIWGWPSTGSRRPGRGGPTCCWSTPPGGSTPRPT
jgi:fused signal recognition particle receptor